MDFVLRMNSSFLWWPHLFSWWWFLLYHHIQRTFFWFDWSQGISYLVTHLFSTRHSTPGFSKSTIQIITQGTLSWWPTSSQPWWNPFLLISFLVLGTHIVLVTPLLNHKKNIFYCKKYILVKKNGVTILKMCGCRKNK